MGLTKRFTNKELISASKAREAHAHNLVANEVFLLPTAKVFVPRLAHYTLLEMSDVFTVYIIQWRPLIIIADNVINRLLLSKSVVPKHSI